jgi:hypothetical protein
MMRTQSICSIPLLLAAFALSSCCTGVRPTPLDRTVELDRAGWLLRADFIAASGRMQVAETEYYQERGKLPTRNQDAGLPAPDDYRGKTLRSAGIQPDGTIVFVFDAKSGVDGGRVRMVPDTSHVAAMSVQWRCESADYAQIQRVIPSCDYVSR